MEVTRYLVIALVLAGGGALQSAAGFGYALLSVTLLLVIGLEPYEAIPIVSMATTIQSATGVWHHRRDVPWRLVASSTLLVLLTIPVGVFLLSRVTLLDDSQVKQVFGAVLIVVVLAFAGWRIQPRKSVPAGWTATAMLSAGLLGGLCGMSGPPIVLWAISHEGWSSQRIRCTLWAIFLLKTPLVIVFLYHRFGIVVLESALLAIAMAPAVLLGTIPGIWIGNRIPKRWLRRIAFTLLVLVGCYMLLQPLVMK